MVCLTFFEDMSRFVSAFRLDLCFDAVSTFFFPAPDFFFKDFETFWIQKTSNIVERVIVKVRNSYKNKRTQRTEER